MFQRREVPLIVKILLAMLATAVIVIPAAPDIAILFGPHLVRFFLSFACLFFLGCFWLVQGGVRLEL